MPGTGLDNTPVNVVGTEPAAVTKALPPTESPPLAPILPQNGTIPAVATATPLSPHTKGLRAFADDDRHFSLVRNFRLADLVTLMNGYCGAMSIFSSARYLVTSDTKFLWYSLMYPLAGMFFDVFDGKVARWRKEASMLGQELDSLADSLSFGVAPALCGFCLGLRTDLDIFLLTVFVCCGIARLARFNATVANLPKDATGKSKYFEGLPIPTSLVLVGIMAECVRRGNFEGPGGSQGEGLPFGLVLPLVKMGIEVHWGALLFGAWAAAMISKSLHVPKL